MALETLIGRYGLLAIGVGAMVEGETVVATGGLLAHRGLLPLSGVVMAAAIGTFVADQVFFLLGRYGHGSRLVRQMTASTAYARAMALVTRYPSAFIFSFRFLWGLRTVSPVALGTTSLAWQRFALLNMVAALLWAVIVTLVGYLLSSSISVLGAELRAVEHYAIAIAALAVVSITASLTLRRWLTKR